MTEYDQSAVGMGDTVKFAASLLETGGQQQAANSLEQFLRPIQIEKHHPPEATWNDSPEDPTLPRFESPKQFNTSEDGHFGSRNQFVGPTVNELDPYFPQIILIDPEAQNPVKDDGTLFFAKNDFIQVHSDARDQQGRAQLNLSAYEQVDGGDKQDITAVRTNSLRGPLIMSGWGFAMDDRPVPPAGDDFPANTNFHKDTPSDPALWKTGPVHLAWDDERQVWAGGPRVVCGVVVTNIPKGKICGGSQFTVRLLRNNQTPDHAITDNIGETITVTNRDPSLEEDKVANQIFCIAIKINYEWLPIWVGCPDTPACGGVGEVAKPDCLVFNDCP